MISSCTLVEFLDYRRVDIDTSVVVDRSRGEGLTDYLDANVTFPRVPCYLLSLDLIDITGELQSDITHSVVKTRLTAADTAVSDLVRRPCGSYYGGEPPEGGCCTSCYAVREAYVR
ncbi:hypothetical protein BJV78DRAFT_94868 [Lactifluus subvellereus]|nr:hypothetical protein BJV78DRAFT_94868 [Lactifluus subvellereus]